MHLARVTAGRPRPARYVAAVVVGWGAGLVFSGWHGLAAGVLPLAVALAFALGRSRDPDFVRADDEGTRRRLGSLTTHVRVATFGPHSLRRLRGQFLFVAVA